MMVPAIVFNAAKIGAIAGFALSVFFGNVLIPKNVERDSPRGKAIRRWILTVVGVLFALALFGFAIDPFGTPVVVVMEAAPPTFKKKVLFGTSSYSFRDGRSAALAPVDGTLVVNDTTTPMHVETHSYGDTSMAMLRQITASREDALPGTVTSVGHPIQHVGPDDPPPPSVEGHYAAERYWLVW